MLFWDGLLDRAPKFNVLTSLANDPCIYHSTCKTMAFALLLRLRTRALDFSFTTVAHISFPQMKVNRTAILN